MVFEQFGDFCTSVADLEGPLQPPDGFGQFGDFCTSVADLEGAIAQFLDVLLISQGLTRPTMISALCTCAL